MIDPTLFQNWMAALGTRIGKPLDERAGLAYYETLSERLDDEGFARAARAVFASHRYASWPATDVFVEAAGGAAPPAPNAAGVAAAAWLVVDESFRLAPPSWRYPDVCGHITKTLGGDPTAVTCLRLIGGASAMARRSGETDWVRKEFLAMWADAVRIVLSPPDLSSPWVRDALALGDAPLRPLALLPSVAAPVPRDRDGEPVRVQDEIVPARDGSGGRASFRAALDALRNEVSPMARAVRRIGGLDDKAKDK